MVQVNSLLVVFVSIFVAQSLFALWLERLNLKHIEHHGRHVPWLFEGLIDVSKLSEIASYTSAKSRLGMIEEAATDILLLTLILSGLLASLDGVLTRWELHYVPAGLIFFLVPALLSSVVELPASLYRTFVIEEKYGFNRSTLKIWIMDHLKAGLLSLLLFGIILSLVLWMIKVSPDTWWFWGFAIVSLVQILLAVIYPVAIAPLFNKFEPIRDELMARKIQRLMEENGIKVKRILQMDAGRRSRHTNAYFTGLGKTKQIVLFDTLLESHSHSEILSVLAHEIGHFKGKHILKQLVLFEALMLAGFYFSYLMLDWPLLYTTFGFSSARPYVGLFFVGIFWQKAGFFLQPLYMALSRHYERQADHFASRLLKTSAPLIAALKKMTVQNLSNLTPHPLYVRFYYSHPSLIERISLLKAVECEQEEPQHGSCEDHPHRCEESESC